MNVIERALLGIFNMGGVFSLDGLKRKTGLDVSNEEMQALKEQSKIESIVLKNRTFYWSTECSKKIDDYILKIIHATRSFNVAMALLEFWSVNRYTNTFDPKYNIEKLCDQLIQVQNFHSAYKHHQEKLLELISDSLEAGHSYFVGSDSLLQTPYKGRKTIYQPIITANSTKNDASNSHQVVPIAKVTNRAKAIEGKKEKTVTKAVAVETEKTIAVVEKSVGTVQMHQQSKKSKKMDAEQNTACLVLQLKESVYDSLLSHAKIHPNDYQEERLHQNYQKKSHEMRQDPLIAKEIERLQVLENSKK